MQKVIFNNRIVTSPESFLKSDNRAFCYGDGLFETIVTGSFRRDLTHKHQERISCGCAVLGIKFPQVLEGKGLSTLMERLFAENRLKGDVRTKLIIWRNTGGLYAPESPDSSFYLKVKATNKPLYTGLETIGLSKTCHTLLSPISFAKTTNALTYVMAGKEMVKQHWDDIVLTDPYGHLAETHLSNLFWVKEGQLYTPALETGCIAGIMRGHLMDFMASAGERVKEVQAFPDEMDHASCIFTTNASGIRYFSRLYGTDKKYEEPLPYLQDFFKVFSRDTFKPPLQP